MAFSSSEVGWVDQRETQHCQCVIRTPKKRSRSLGFTFVQPSPPDSDGGRPVVLITESAPSARVLYVVGHEIGHATKYHFVRDTFGMGDHSPSVGAGAAGLMRAVDQGDTKFSPDDVQILRGLIP